MHAVGVPNNFIWVYHRGHTLRHLNDFLFFVLGGGEKIEDITKLNYPLADEVWELNRVSECLIEIGKANSSLSCIQLPDFKLKSTAKVR